MAFDVGAGVAAMGEQVAKVTGLAALEQQKSGLETERLKIANDLAMQRESAGRKEAHTLDMEKLDKSQAFQGSEGDKNRTTQLEAHRISAAASAASAGAHLQGIREQIAFQSQQPDYKIGEDGTLFSIPKQGKGTDGKPTAGTATPVMGADGKPVHFANPEKAKAQAELITTVRDQSTTLYRLFETDLKSANAAYKAALDGVKVSAKGMMDPLNDPQVIEARKEIEAVHQKYQPKIDRLEQQREQLSTSLGIKAGLPTQKPGGYDFSKYLPTSSAAAPAAPAPTAPAGGGLINNF